MTSWPASAARAAATAESTPPDMAATTFISALARLGRPGALDDRADRLDEGVDVGGVEVWPSEKRSECRAWSSSQPMASRTWDGCGTPAEQAEPVEHSMPAGVEQHQQRVALAAGEAEVGVAGEPIVGIAVEVRVGDDLDHAAYQVVAQLLAAGSRARPGP